MDPVSLTFVLLSLLFGVILCGLFLHADKKDKKKISLFSRHHD
jgi:hypothetical protein